MRKELKINNSTSDLWENTKESKTHVIGVQERLGERTRKNSYRNNG